MKILTKTADKHSKTVSVLMPVYNEQVFLRKCVEKVLTVTLPENLTIELVVVDDCSTDGSNELIDELAKEHPDKIKAFHQPVNMGKGAAIRRAIEECSGIYIIWQDADLEYDPEEYPMLLEPILAGHADVVYGSRFMPRSMCRVLNYHHTLGNRLLTFISNVLTGLNLTDMETCYKVFKADILKTIPLRSNRFGIEPEITAKIAKRDCIVYEVPINYYGRTYANGKKIGWKDGVSAIYTILKYFVIDDCYNERYGHDILNNMSTAHRFNRWMVDVLVPHMGNRVLEVGSGIGNITNLLPHKEYLTVTDNDPVYIKMLQDNCANNHVINVAKLDLNSDEDFNNLGKKYDTIICLNVLEHIEDDGAALRRMYNVLEPEGKLLLLVPQYKSLYGSYDEMVNHFRRYDKKELCQLIEKAGLKIKWTRGFNFASIFGWWLNAVVMKRTSMGKYQLKLFDMLVPILRIIEAVLPLPGLSIIVVAEKPAEGNKEQNKT